MMYFLFATENLPFSIALAVMLIIAALEGVSTLLGLGIFGFLDTLLPDLDLEIDADLDINSPDFQHPAPFTKLLAWFRIGQVPAIILLIVFLSSFGLIGLILQSVLTNVIGAMLPALIAAVPVFFLSLPVVRLVGGILARIVPKDETDAVSEKSFIGRIAFITIGRAKAGSPAQAKLKDGKGQTHYIMVEPNEPEDVFEQGSPVLLISQQGAVFRAIQNPSEALTDTDV